MGIAVVLFWTCRGDGDVDIECVVNTSVITGPLFGDQGIKPPRRMSYAPAEKVGFHVGSSDLENGPVTMELGPLNRRVTIDFAPEAQAAGEVSFDFTDEDAKPGYQSVLCSRGANRYGDGLEQSNFCGLCCRLRRG